MGKKGSWISALKKAFAPSSKDKGLDKYAKEKKKWGLGRTSTGEVNSFIPLHREPSSIEKILEEVEKEQQYKSHQVPYKKIQQPKVLAARSSAISDTFTNVNSNKQDDVSLDTKKSIAQDETHEGPYKNIRQSKTPAASPSASIDKSTYVISNKTQPISLCTKKSIIQDKAKSIPPSKEEIIHISKSITTNYAHILATKIQAAYRGYVARKNYKSLKGLVRLQKMMKGGTVKHQTMNTMRSMQLLVRIQTQIHARRLQKMDNQNTHQHWISGRSNKEIISNLSKWNTTNQLERGTHDWWDSSMLTKEERDASMRRKMEAVIKRERALAYAYSHQLLSVTTKSAHATPSDARSGWFPWLRNWLENHTSSDPQHPEAPEPPTPKTTATPTASTTLSHPFSHRKPSKSPFDASTLRSAKPLHTHDSSNRWRAMQARTALKDDSSLTSCPAFTASTSATGVPSYMAPTASAKAKVRATTTDRGGGGKESRRRFSFALSQSIGSIRLFAASKDVTAPPQATREAGGRHRSIRSVGELSVDSTVSLPQELGRRTFK